MTDCLSRVLSHWPTLAHVILVGKSHRHVAWTNGVKSHRLDLFRNHVPCSRCMTLSSLPHISGNVGLAAHSSLGEMSCGSDGRQIISSSMASLPRERFNNHRTQFPTDNLRLVISPRVWEWVKIHQNSGFRPVHQHISIDCGMSRKPFDLTRAHSHCCHLGRSGWREEATHNSPKMIQKINLCFRVVN